MLIAAAGVLLPVLIQGPGVGERFPVYPLPPVCGTEQPFRAAAFAGKPALIHVFASW